MSCDPERVTGYVDGALEAGALAEMEAHLASCADCAERAAFERDLHGRLRALNTPEARPDLEANVRRRLRAARPSRLRWALPLAASLAALVFWGRGAAPFVAWELARDHAHCFGFERLPAQVWSDDPARVAAWFEENGTPIPLVPAAVRALELVGGRHCPLFVDRTRVAHLYYVAPGHHVSVFVLPHAVRANGSYERTVGGAAVRLVRVSGVHVGIVGEHPEDVKALARAMATTVAADLRGDASPRLLID